MSGTIEVSPQRRWSAASWLFDWTVGYLADQVTDEKLAAELREIVDENLGWLGLDDYGPDARADLVAILRDRIVPAAAVDLPGTVDDRPAVLALLRELADATG
ncbi:MAG: hypothetical protein HOV77_14615 [Hamadaea sp.]|uniref:hypothetical protein n=1 Tax=Hamadaea sp. TaxID=2024425 RepID=UPI0018255C5F|nr:hypothetical protein [Hamadaea sp.]NUT20416.1 hypothetical protein [Hamadaea sp.]